MSNVIKTMAAIWLMAAIGTTAAFAMPQEANPSGYYKENQATEKSGKGKVEAAAGVKDFGKKSLPNPQAEKKESKPGNADKSAEGNESGLYYKNYHNRSMEEIGTGEENPGSADLVSEEIETEYYNRNFDPEYEQDNRRAEKPDYKKDTAEMSESKSGFGFFSWLQFFLILAIIGYLVYQRRKESQKPKGRAGHSRDSVSASDLRELETHITQLERKCRNLEISIAEFSKRRNAAYGSGKAAGNARGEEEANARINRRQERQAAPNRPEKKITKRYCMNFTPEGIAETDLVETNNEYMQLELHIDGEKANFIVNQLPQAQFQMISNIAFGVGRVVDIISKVDSPSRIITVKPGSVKLHNGFWKITGKAQVELK